MRCLRIKLCQTDLLGLLRRPILVPGIATPISAARALIDAIGRLSLTVMSVMLFPARDISRSSSSSSADHRSWRVLRVNMTTQLDRSYKPAPAHAGGVAFLRIQSPFHGQADKRDSLEPISRAIDSHHSKHHARVSLIGYGASS